MDNNTTLSWNDERSVFGFRVRAHFFDPRVVDAETDYVKRNLPVFASARPRLIATETDRRNFVAGRLIAQPDGVLAHGGGLLCLELKPQGGRGHRRDRWYRDIPCSGMLQVLVASVAVATEMARPVAPLLRCHDAFYFLTPSPQLLRFVLLQIEPARAYWESGERVNASELAQYCEPRVRREFWTKDDDDIASSEAGQARHAELLRR